MKNNLLSRLFYKGKHHRKEEKDNFTAMLMPSVLGILLCAVCLMGSTWAWFTATQSTATQTIQAADYNVSAVVKSGEKEIAAENGTYTLTQGEYTVTLAASGEATTGYCILDFSGTKTYTEQIAKDTSITLNLKINEPVALEITAVWGTYAGDGKISTEYTYGNAKEIPPADEKDETTEPPADTTDDTTTEETTTTETEPTLDPTQYTVQSGDSLGKIADLYGVSVERLQAYNSIENPSLIYRGQVIKIPPADWKIPETTTEETKPAETEPTPEQTTPITTEPSEDTESEA